MLDNLRQRFSELRQHRFVRSVAFLQVANILGNFIQAVIGIFIARILQPNLYGVYAVAFSLASLVFISTGVQETITVALAGTYARGDRERTVSALGFFIRFTTLFAAITLAVTAFLPKLAGFFYHDPHIGTYAAIVIIASTISSFAFTMTSISLQVSNEIPSMARLALFDQALRFALSLALVFAGYGILGAAFGHLIGAVVVLAVSLAMYHRLNQKHKIFPSWGELWHAAWRSKGSGHLSMSLWVTVDKNIAMLYNILPVLMAGIYLSRSEVSFFKLAFGFITLALSLLGPVSTLLDSELSRMRVEDPERMKKNFARVSWYGMGISTLLTAAALVTGPFVFKFLYGASYLPSVKYVFGLAIYGVFYGIGVALGSMWRVVNKVRISIVINTIVLGIGVPTGLYLISRFGGWGAVIMVSAWFTVSHLTSFFYLLRYAE